MNSFHTEPDAKLVGKENEYVRPSQSDIVSASRNWNRLFEISEQMHDKQNNNIVHKRETTEHRHNILLHQSMPVECDSAFPIRGASDKHCTAVIHFI